MHGNPALWAVCTEKLESPRVLSHAGRVSATAPMSTNESHDIKAADSIKGRPGWYLGTDGLGREHHYEVGVKAVHVDGEGRIEAPADADLIDWALHVIDVTDAYWQEIKVDPPACHWLTGAKEVGER